MKIAIIDDQNEIRFSVSKILQKNNHEVFAFTGSEPLIAQTLLKHKVELIVLDVMLETHQTGIDLLREFQSQGIAIPVILMTAFTTPENLIEASKLRVYDVLQKPFEKTKFLEVIAKYDIKNSTHINAQSKLHTLDKVEKKFIGSFETMGEVYRHIGLCANNDVAVLINGETGTGKELVAQLIHTSSHRASSPFVAVNCASIPSDLFESHFFGHEKGSFTSADKQHIGYAEQTKEGTLFLDEIGELDIVLQSKLLRFLETKTFRRVGGTRDIAFKGRIISATNVDLETYIADNRFREDLFFRLGMTTILIPPLRERKQDIPLLVNHFISLANKDLQTKIDTISDDALNALLKREWCGNIRELRNTIYNASLNAKNNTIRSSDLHVKAKKASHKETNLSSIIAQKIEQEGVERATLVLNEIEKAFYEEVVRRSENFTKASEYLGISRLTLRKILKKYALQV